MVAIRWGIIGTGRISRLFAADLQLGGHTLNAVASRTKESAKAFAAEFNIAAAHGSYEALVEDPTIDVVYIATPHPQHLPNAALAIRAGKSVLVEKPFTVTAGEAAELRDLANEHGGFLMEAMWTRFLPHVTRIQEILAEDGIGQLRSFSADHSQLLPSDPTHRLNSLALGGGALLDLGVYPVSFASLLFGEPHSIQATASLKETGVDAQVATIFGYSGGQIATSLSSSDARGPNTAVILGTEGRIEIDPVWYSTTGFRRYDSSNQLVETFTSTHSGRGMQFQAAEVERAIRAGKTSSDIMPVDESVRIMETLDTIRAQIGVRYPGE